MHRVRYDIAKTSPTAALAPAAEREALVVVVIITHAGVAYGQIEEQEKGEPKTNE